MHTLDVGGAARVPDLEVHMPSGLFERHLDEMHDDAYIEQHSVFHVMHRPAVSCPQDATVADALGLMFKHDVGVLPIVDARQQVVGIATDRDLARAVYRAGRAPADIPVTEAMTTPVHIIGSLTPLPAAVAALRQHQVRRLPVVDEAGRLVGILSLDDLARARARASAQEAAEVTDALASVAPTPR